MISRRLFSPLQIFRCLGPRLWKVWCRGILGSFRARLIALIGSGFDCKWKLRCCGLSRSGPGRGACGRLITVRVLGASAGWRGLSFCIEPEFENFVSECTEAVRGWSFHLPVWAQLDFINWIKHAPAKPIWAFLSSFIQESQAWKYKAFANQ